MKNSITILLITLIGCTSNPAPTEEVPKKDSVIVVDTTKNPNVQSRAAAIEEPLTKAEIVNLVNYQVAQQMSAIPDQNWTTIRKDVGYLVGEVDRLTTENLILKDRLDSFHYVSFNPDDFDAIKGEQTDSVSLKKL